MLKRTFKATGKLTQGASLYRKWSEWAVGDIVIGKYIATHTDKKYGKLGRVIEVISADFKDGSGAKYEGNTLTLNQTGKLHKALDAQPFGIVLQLTFKGKAAITSGPYAGEEANDMEILIGEIEGEEQEEVDL